MCGKVLAVSRLPVQVLHHGNESMNKQVHTQCGRKKETTRDPTSDQHQHECAKCAIVQKEKKVSTMRIGCGLFCCQLVITHAVESNAKK